MGSQREHDCDDAGQRRPKKQLMVLEAEVRRSVMRVLNASETPVSTLELADELGCDRQTMIYQLSVLADYRLVTRYPREVSGATTSFSWSSASQHNAGVMARLEGKAVSDAIELKARKQHRRDQTQAAA